MRHSTDLRNQGWGYSNWYQRFTSMASPNQFLFGDDGVPLINSENGVAATQEYIDSLSHHSPMRSAGAGPSSMATSRAAARR